MGDKTGIEYLNATWNTIKGCSHVSPGCDNCWAERQAARFGKPGEHFHGLTEEGCWAGKAKFYDKELYKPIHWKRPRRIGVCFMGDLFHESLTHLEVAQVFAVMSYAKQHTFMVLTKRPQRMKEFLVWAGSRVCPSECLYDYIEDDIDIDYERDIAPWPLPNVWLGVSVEDQTTANDRIPLLLECPGHHYISAEPLLGPIDIDLAMYGEGDTRFGGMNAFGFTDGFGYEACLRGVIVGGESGPGARPMHPNWVRSIRDQCKEADVPFFFKQWGEFVPGEIDIDGNIKYRKIGKRLAGRTLNGKTYEEIPRVR